MERVVTGTDRYKHLRALAERATQGRWRLHADTPWGSKVVVNESGEMYLGVSLTTPAPTDGWNESARQRARELGANKCADAAYIAALRPEVVLELLHELEKATAPIPMRLPCPECRELHVDEGEFAAKPHHTHACQECGNVWRPAIVETIGVRFLPGFKNDDNTVDCEGCSATLDPETCHYDDEMCPLCDACWAFELTEAATRTGRPASS